MLGEKLGSMQLTTSNKVLPSIDGLPSFETTTMGAGTLVGAEVQGMATYTSDMRADGTLYGECPNSGVVMAQDGVATFTATGIGRFTEDGGSSFKGMVYFQTSAPSLSSLNGMAVVYDWLVDAEGNASWDMWEWK
ncbi:MAG: hypothetical protein FI699_03360 [SAR202 cluster bacterium]|nr:hypothetical protein [Chloroflexota bacterium]MQG87897.1 hypothetical protein [SAR202 cluster bacterium]|tara:strand:+ start:105 stop:509 length:405 start_codon:yes stop_codon:yes gene_type:complete